VNHEGSCDESFASFHPEDSWPLLRPTFQRVWLLYIEHHRTMFFVLHGMWGPLEVCKILLREVERFAQQAITLLREQLLCMGQ
jgi:hypothetical protein